MKLLFISSPVGPLGSGEAGGVEQILLNIPAALAKKNHAGVVVAARGSVTPPGGRVCMVDGVPAPDAMRANRHAVPLLRADGLLEAAWQKAASIQGDFDAIINCTYDWLSFYVAPFFTTPVFNIVHIQSLNASVDAMMAMRYAENPGRFALVSRCQARTYGFLRLIQ